MVTKLAQLIASLVQGDKTGEQCGLKPQKPTLPQSPTTDESHDAEQAFASSSEQTDVGVQITAEFRKTFDLIDSGEPFIFVTGRAGTGKSTFISLLKQRLKNYAVVAPTGVAALNVGGQTIHSFFKFPPRPIELSSIRPVRNRIAYQSLKTLIIDEISMVRADMLDAIDTFLRHNGPKLDTPFGGVQVIVVGDLYQLPPIVATEEEQIFIENEYKSPFFFRAKCFSVVGFKTVEFTQVFRQNDEQFVSILNRIREGQDLRQSLEVLQSRVMSTPIDTHRRIVLCSTNAVADGINYRKLKELKAPVHTYTGTITGDFKIDLNKLPAPLSLDLKEGAQVMFAKNARDKQWVNGTIGVVVRCDISTVEVEIETRLGKKRVSVGREKWETFEYRYNFSENSVVAHEVGKYEQIPLMPAWAVTIHKSQGKTFDYVHIDLGHGAFAEGQVYVALSRCRTLEGVTLERPVTLSDIRLHKDVVDFATAGYSLAP